MAGLRRNEDGGGGGVPELLAFLKYVESTFTGTPIRMSVRQHLMLIEIQTVHREIADYVVRTKLFPGVQVATQHIRDDWYSLELYIDLAEIDNFLVRYLDVRRCWGLVRLSQWIVVIEEFTR